MTTSDRRRNRVAPRLETLEDRCQPAVAINFFPGPGILVLSGDAAANQVTITDQGHNLPGGVTATITGIGPPAGFVSNGIPVKRIVVLTGDGNDTVRYNLTGNLGVERAVEASLGRHLDSFIARLGGDLLPGSVLRLSVDGGLHRDLVQLDASADVDVAAGASLLMGLNGGPAGDNVIVRYRGEMDGHLLMDADGGPDGANDVVAAQFDLDAGSSGLLEAVERGHMGDDYLRLVIHKRRADPAVVRGLIDGGPGFDIAVHTPNVKVVNCESEVMVP
jgi:hypothetical protein